MNSWSKWLYVSACISLTSPWAATAGSVERQVRYGFTLQNTRGDVLPLAELWTHAPVERTSTQVRRALRASHPYDLVADDLGNQVLHFAFTNLPPYAVKIVTVEADLALTDEPAPLAAEAAPFLQSDAMMPFDSAEFGSLAPAFGAPEGGQSAARPIFDWVCHYLRDSGYQEKDRGALHALRAREGDCTEYMYLFAALCRRQGIPARGMGGYVCTRNRVLTPAGYHNWAEFYEDGAWRLADPQKRRFKENASLYVAMRVLGKIDGPMRDFARFRFEGEGLKVRMNDR